jgi:HK97 family phage portal protein
MFLSTDIGDQRSPTDDFWYGPVGNQTLSGARVSSDTALRLSVVFACVRVRAETLGMLPWITYRRIKDGKERAEHELSGLLATQPNEWQTAMQWRMMMEAHHSLRGNAYSRIVYNGAGRVDYLQPVHPDAVRLEITPSGTVLYRVTQKDGSMLTLVWGEVFHVAGLSLDGLTGLNPIEMERESIGMGIAARDYGARFFLNDARPPGYISVEATFKDKEAKTKFRESIQEAQTGVNRHKLMVLEAGMKYNELGIKQTDAQYLETLKHTDLDIARIFRMQPHKIGILDRATWANIEHQNIEFVTDCMMPIARAWEQAAQRDLFLGDEEYFSEFLLDMLLRGDTAARYEAYGKAIKDGWLTRNEVRSAENRNPLTGLDQPLQPLNMAAAGSEQARRVPSQREQKLAMVSAERVVNKEVSAVRKMYERASAAQDVAGMREAVDTFYSEFGNYVSHLMSVESGQGTAYAESSRAELVGALDAEISTGASVVQPLLQRWESQRAAQIANLGA